MPGFRRRLSIALLASCGFSCGGGPPAEAPTPLPTATPWSNCYPSAPFLPYSGRHRMTVVIAPECASTFPLSLRRREYSVRIDPWQQMSGVTLLDTDYVVNSSRPGFPAHFSLSCNGLYLEVNFIEYVGAHAGGNFDVRGYGTRYGPLVPKPFCVEFQGSISTWSGSNSGPGCYSLGHAVCLADVD